MATPLESTQGAFQSFTQAEHIQQLNDIDKKLHELLQSAGLALQTLSETRREDFELSTNTYLRGLQAIDVGVKRQIYGLEEAGIIPAEKKKGSLRTDDLSKRKDVKAGIPGMPQMDSSATEMGIGKLDVGWLNSNSGQVGRDMESELWAKAKEFLEAQNRDSGHGEINTAG